MSISRQKKQTWIIKSGSSLITNHGQGLDTSFISHWVEQIVALRNKNIDCILVSSGAVAEGLKRLNIQKRPEAIHELQAAAAIGQMGLIQEYEMQFQKHNLHTAQILLTHDDLSNRERYLNARGTLKTLLANNVIPIVNENDTIVIDEIRVGDNDTLAALVANLMDADTLVLLTDQNGLYTEDPAQNKSAKLITEAHAGDPELIKMASKGKPGEVGRGGMLTKIRAAERAARSGTNTIIAAGKETNILLQIAKKATNTGTWVRASQEPMAARKQWLASHLQVKGYLTIDEGAKRVLNQNGKSLLPIGVLECEGDFLRGEAVMCRDKKNNTIAIGLINYNSDETRRIIGKSSQEIQATLNYINSPELIHRDNLALI